MTNNWLRFTGIMAIVMIAMAVIVPCAISHVQGQSTIDISVISVSGALIAGMLHRKEERP